jgi:hypothetical protein
MSAFTQYTDAAARCAFCVKPLPTVNGELQPWRAASGLFFCNEFCADDAEEARFQSHPAVSAVDCTRIRDNRDW